MKGVLDLFLAQPLGTRSLMQRIFGMAISDGIKSAQKPIDVLREKIDDDEFCSKIRNYTNQNESVKTELRKEAADEDIDLVVAILRSDHFEPELESDQIGRVFNAFVAWRNAADNVRARSRAIELTVAGRPRNAGVRRALRAFETASEAYDPAS